MPESNLRAALIKLAAARPELRAHLLPLLAPQQALPPAAPSIIVQQAPAPAPVIVHQPAPAPVVLPPPPVPAPVPVRPAPPPPPAPAPAPPPAPAPEPVPAAPPVRPAPARPAAPAPVTPPPSATQPVVAQPPPPVGIQQEPTPPPPALETEPQSDIFVTNRTQRGFDADLAPELDRMLTLGWSRDQVAEWGKIRVRDAFRAKDSLYLILIRHQSTFEPEDRYRESIERAIENWRDRGNYQGQTGV